MFKAKDLMTTQVVTVNVDDTIDHAITLMVKHRISGLPVLGREGRPVGIISEFDCLELISEGQTEQDLVSHYMSPGVFGVAEEDSWGTVVDAFRSKRRPPPARLARRDAGGHRHASRPDARHSGCPSASASGSLTTSLSNHAASDHGRSVTRSDEGKRVLKRHP